MAETDVGALVGWLKSVDEVLQRPLDQIALDGTHDDVANLAEKAADTLQALAAENEELRAELSRLQAERDGAACAARYLIVAMRAHAERISGLGIVQGCPAMSTLRAEAARAEELLQPTEGE